MAKIYYPYKFAFVNSLLPLSSSRYLADYNGSACWKYLAEKAVYGVTYTTFKSAVDIDFVLVIEYFDEAAGFLRIEYDSSNVLTDATITTLAGDSVWKTVQYEFTGRLNDILADGDFQLFAADAEDTTADLNLAVRRVGILRDNIQTMASWQTIGLAPFDTDDYEPETVGGAAVASYDVITSNTTLTAAQCAGGVIIVDGGYDITLPAISTLGTDPIPNVQIVFMQGSGAVYPNAADRMWANDSVGSDGDPITPQGNGACVWLVRDDNGWTGTMTRDIMVGFGGG